MIDIFNFNSYHSAIPAQSDGFAGFIKDYLQNSINSNGAVVISQIIFDIKRIILNPNDKNILNIFYLLDTILVLGLILLTYLAKLIQQKKILTTNPGYGADLSFKVYKTDNDYYIRVSYRNSYNSDNNIIILKIHLVNLKNIL